MNTNRIILLLLESIFFTLCWLINDYIALILTVTLTAIMGSILLIGLVAERIERSRVPSSFFWTLFYGLIPPIVIGILYHLAIEGHYLWLSEL